MVKTDHVVRAVSKAKKMQETTLEVTPAANVDQSEYGNVLYLPLYGDSKDRVDSFLGRNGTREVREAVFDRTDELPYVQVIASNGDMLILPVPSDEIDHAEDFFHEQENRQTA